MTPVEYLRNCRDRLLREYTLGLTNTIAMFAEHCESELGRVLQPTLEDLQLLLDFRENFYETDFECGDTDIVIENDNLLPILRVPPTVMKVPIDRDVMITAFGIKPEEVENRCARIYMAFLEERQIEV